MSRALLTAALALAAALPAPLARAQNTNHGLWIGLTPEGPFSQVEMFTTGEGAASLFLVDPTGTAFVGSSSNALVAWQLGVDFADLSLAPSVGSPAVVSPAGIEVSQVSGAFDLLETTYGFIARDGALFGGPGSEPSLVAWTVTPDFATVSAPVTLAPVGTAAAIASIPGTGNFAVNRIDGVTAQQQVTQTYDSAYLPIGSPVNGASSPFPALETPDIHVAADGTQVVSVLNINNNTLSVYAVDALGNRGPTRTFSDVSSARVHALEGGRAVVLTLGFGGAVIHHLDNLLIGTAGTERPIHAGFGTNPHISEASQDGIVMATYTANSAVYGRAINTVTGAEVGGSFLVSAAEGGGNVFNGASAAVGNAVWMHGVIQQPSFNIITVGSIAHQDRNGQSIFRTAPGELLVLADAFPNSQTPVSQSQNLTYDTPGIGSFAIVENPESAFDGAVMFDFDDEGTLTVEAGASWQDVAEALGTDEFIIGVSFDMMVSEEVMAVEVAWGGFLNGAAFLEENTGEVLDLEEYRGLAVEYSQVAVVTLKDLAMTEGNAGFVLGSSIQLEFRSGGGSDTRGGTDPEMGTVYLDNIRITARAIPEPGTGALLLAAVFGTRIRRRRNN